MRAFLLYGVLPTSVGAAAGAAGGLGAAYGASIGFALGGLSAIGGLALIYEGLWMLGALCGL